MASAGFKTEPFLLVALGYVYYTFTFNMILPLACWPPASAAAEKLGKFAIICLGILGESEFHLLQGFGFLFVLKCSSSLSSKVEFNIKTFQLEHTGQLEISVEDCSENALNLCPRSKQG